MNETKSRLFIAVPLDRPVRSSLAGLSGKLKPQFAFRKWTHPEDYHITLQFLGDTDGTTEGRIKAALVQIARRFSAFSLVIEGLGTFGAPAAPKVLYAGVKGDLPALSRLQSAVVEAMEPLGFAREERPYTPHLTLARKYTGSGPFSADRLAAAAGEAAGSSAAGCPAPPLDLAVREIVLYASHLGKSPMYEPVAVFPLQGANELKP